MGSSPSSDARKSYIALAYVDSEGSDQSVKRQRRAETSLGTRKMMSQRLVPAWISSQREDLDLRLVPEWCC